jgi:hypothetical protein
LYLLLISGFLPVASWVFNDNSLIINGIHFSGALRVKLWVLKGMLAFSGWCCGARGCVLFFCGWSFCNHIVFIVHFLFCRFFAGFFCVFWCNSLIINTIHFSGMHAIACYFLW